MRFSNHSTLSNFPYKVILGSQSPRRKELFSNLNIPFSIKVIPTNESYPKGLSNGEVAEFIAQQKAVAFSLSEKELVVTADTIVCLGNQVLGKPTDEQEAIHMLRQLSNCSHDVITGVCIRTVNKQVLFSDTTKVFFRELSVEEINYYVRTFLPFDKAGSYGIQEWVGQVGIDRIEGSYFNVMGLPTNKLYSALLKMI